MCKGYGVDIGCMKEEWAFPGAETVDPQLNNYHALDFPYNNLDYIFSSHCLEHISNWVDAMDYWYHKLKVGGTLFLYLPDYSQEYWRPWNNRKHVNIFSPNIIEDYMIDRGYNNIFKSGVDLNNAFMVVGSKV
jgi:predicted SAM-dependent methyltransferase